MPSPISGNSSVYDPSQQLSQTEGCDSSSASCATSTSSAAPRTVTLDPVYVVGDLGARALVEQHERKQVPSCVSEQRDAVLACAAAGGAVLAGVASATTVLGAAGGVVVALTSAVNCGRELRALRDCENGS